MAEPVQSSEAPGIGEDPLSAMTERFNLIFRLFAHRFFRHFDLDDATVERLRDLEKRGTVVYVMRYASRLDYFLFNTLFLREGLRLSSFANGIRFLHVRPWLEAARLWWRRPRGVSQDVELVRAREYARELTREGASLFLFLRTAYLRTQLRSRRRAIAEQKTERDLLSEVVRAAQTSERDVHVVPLALFWRKGPRAPRRFLNLSYGSNTRPSDLAKVTSFLTTYRGLHVKVGEPVDVKAFASRSEGDAPTALSSVLRRMVLTYLYREEKVVEGPVLQPRHRVQDLVVRTAPVRAAIAEQVRETGITRERGRLQAEKMFREIAANMNSTFLALLSWSIGSVTKRLFNGVEVSGLEKISDYAKRHPIVLVPSHRSYFDFIILSLLFYDRHLMPPHIAARENMAFGPFGFIWRRAGAFFLRRSFDDPLYKAVFRTYVSYLIKEGFTQEFFIEGGRSRTGKTLPPRLGMLSWNVEAFLESGRRDLFFVPIAITYERLVEEGAMVGELEGEEKSEESMLGLMRARRFLRLRFGSVFVNFGEPISLAEALGDRRQRFAGEETPELEAERRAFVDTMGRRIVERINWAVAANATAVASCALLGERRRGLFRHEFAHRMQQIVDLLHLQDVRLTPELSRDEGEFGESIASMLRMDLLKSADDTRGEILYFEPGKRRALDIYRNSILHFLAAPSFLARRLEAGASEAELRADLSQWLDLLGRELFVHNATVLAGFTGFLDHFTSHGWIRREEGRWRPTEEGLPELRFLAELTRPLFEAYFALCEAAAGVGEEPLTSKDLLKAAAEQFEHAAILGEVGLAESANDVTFGNAVDLLLERKILERAPAAGSGRERREKRYQRGPAFDELPDLTRRLASALAPR
ncbi:MAG: 1-acyl-sn-glycerol-3-phosphate acyltransferase [Myxococcota bacterium]